MCNFAVDSRSPASKCHRRTGPAKHGNGQPTPSRGRQLSEFSLSESVQESNEAGIGWEEGRYILKGVYLGACS